MGPEQHDRDPDPIAETSTAATRHGALVALLVAAATCSLVEAASMDLAAAWRVAGVAAVGLATAGFTRAAVVRPLLTSLAAERRRADERARGLELSLERHRLVHRAAEALAVAEDEGDALSAAASAAREALGARHDVSLLLCSSSDAAVAWRAEVDAGGLTSPLPHEGDGRCVAAVRHHTSTVPSTTSFEACPHAAGPARDSDDVGRGATSSVCVPIMNRGATTAVIHVTGAEGDVPERSVVALLEEVAALAGRRVMELTPAAPPATTMQLDPLTGLPNHRTAVAAMKELIGGLTPFSLAVCDIDTLGAYNEAHGTEAGDRALQVFAEALRTTLRPGDVVVRWGGDEFLAVFPRCSSPNAQAAMERVRETVVLSMAADQMPPFTCSTGVVDSNQGTSIDELLETADLALSVAKHEGGNRVRTAVF